MRRILVLTDAELARLRLDCWHEVSAMKMRDGVENVPVASGGNLASLRYEERPRWRGLTWAEQEEHTDRLVAFMLGEEASE